MPQPQYVLVKEASVHNSTAVSHHKMNWQLMNGTINHWWSFSKRIKCYKTSLSWIIWLLQSQQFKAAWQTENGFKIINTYYDDFTCWVLTLYKGLNNPGEQCLWLQEYVEVLSTISSNGTYSKCWIKSCLKVGFETMPIYRKGPWGNMISAETMMTECGSRTFTE